MVALGREPEENETTSLEQYYENQNRSHVLGPLLAFAAVIGVALLVTGLFFGGRWGYNKLTDNDSPSEKVASVVEDKPTQISVEQNNNSDSTAANNPTTSAKGGEAQTSSNVQSKSTTPQNPSSTTSETQSTPPAKGSTFTSSTNTDQLPNNGPGDVLLVFLAVSAISYLLHANYTARKING